jgi:hypothetical protein
MKIKILLTTLTSLMLISCCGQKTPEIYSKNLPKLDIRRYFKGDLEAYGILQDRSGKVTKTFTVKMHGSWKGNVGTLKEHFVFSDGKTSERIWTLTMIDEHNFTASAADVVGIAKGQQYGNAMKMDYVLTIPVDDKTYDIKIKDWLYLIDPNSLVNVSTMTKFGFKVGSLTIGFKKIGI